MIDRYELLMWINKQEVLLENEIYGDEKKEINRAYWNIFR